jgi:hypothetical protein
MKKLAKATDPFLESTGATDNQVASLVSMLPYWEILADAVFLDDGRAYVAFEIEMPPGELYGPSEQAVLLRGLKQVLRMVGQDGETLRLIISVKEGNVHGLERYRQLIQVEHGFLFDLGEAQYNNTRHLAEQKVLNDFRFYFCVPVGAPRLGYRVASPAVALLSEVLPFLKGKKHFSFNQEELAGFLKEIDRKKFLFQQLLQTAGLRATLLSGDALYRLIFEYLNPSLPTPTAPYQPTFDYVPGNLSKEENHPGKTLRSTLVRSMVDNRYWDRLRVGSHTLGFWRLADVPNETFFGMLAPLLDAAGKQLWVVLDFTRLSKEQGEGRLRYKFRDQYITAGATDVPDVGAEEGAREASEYIRYIRQSGDHLYNVNALFILVDPSEKELERRMDRFWAKASSFEGNPFLRLQRGTFRSWLQAAPFSGQALSAPRMYPETQAVHFIPWQSPWRHEAKNPKELYFTRWLTPITHDPFDDSLPNYNSLTIGTSGGGKSYNVQNRLVESLKTGDTMAVAIDRHRWSYWGLYKVLEEDGHAEFLEFGPGSDTVINPFHLEPGTYELGPEKQLEVFALLRAMVPGNPQRADPAIENRILRAAIEQTYHRLSRQVKGESGWVVDFGQNVPTISDLVETLENLSSIDGKTVTDETRAIALKLSYAFAEWSRRTALGALFDGPSTFRIAPEKRFVYIVVKEIEGNPDFFAVAMLATVQAVWNAIKKTVYPRKVIVLEEAWHLLKNRDSAEFVYDLFRRGRTLGIGTWAVSQNLADFAAEHAAPILTNVAQFYVTRASGDEEVLEQIARILQTAPPSLIEQLPGMTKVNGAYAEFMLWLKLGEGGEGGILRLDADPVRYWTFTTAPKEREEREALARQLGYQRAVRRLAGVE